MAATHTAVVAQASATNTATSTTTGGWIDLTGSYGSVLLAKITNGGTGPTIACGVSLDLSPDNGTTVYASAGGGPAAATTTASAVAAWSFNLPAGTMYVRTVFTGNTAQSVTIQADITKLTGL